MVNDNQWAYDLEKVIYSIVSSQIRPLLIDEYPDIYITDSDKALAKPQFPTVYIHSMSAVEEGADLEGQAINALRATVQVEVSTNKDKEEARKVMSVLAEIFKTMRFKVIAMPETKSSGEINRSVARFRRIVGANDKLI